MKKSILYIVAASSLMLASCDSMLDKNPRDKFSNTPEFWNNANQLESYSNGFYENYVGYSNGSTYGWYYFKSLSDDQNNPDFDNWTFTTIPNTSANWKDKFTAIRRINYLLDGNDGMGAFKLGTDKVAPQEASNNSRFLILNYFQDMMKQGIVVDAKVEGRIKVKR